MRGMLTVLVFTTGALMLSACAAKTTDPRQAAPDNTRYYTAGAEPLARCFYRAGLVTERCGTFALALGQEEDGKTHTVRCYRQAAAAPGAAGAGAGLMGFVVGQALDRAVADSFSDDPNQNTMFMIGARDVGGGVAQVRLWFTPIVFNTESRFADVAASLDKCAGSGPLAAPPADVPAPARLAPASFTPQRPVDPATVTKGAAPPSSAPPKTEGKSAP